MGKRREGGTEEGGDEVDIAMVLMLVVGGWLEMEMECRWNANEGNSRVTNSSHESTLASYITAESFYSISGEILSTQYFSCIPKPSKRSGRFRFGMGNIRTQHHSKIHNPNRVPRQGTSRRSNQDSKTHIRTPRTCSHTHELDSPRLPE